MYDEMMYFCLTCEGIFCGKRLDMYHFTSSFLADHSPGQRLTDVDIVSSDGFFNRHIVIDLGFTNSYFFYDQFHLIDSGLLNFLESMVST